ncbi:hypothetical protein TNCV_528451 [Trichonephila clavipes]|nr:hypothetical protein TNCV_528451 [Trichonephila clavipes]
MLYHRTILEPHTAYPIPAGTNNIVLTVQKTAFGLDIIPESPSPPAHSEGIPQETALPKKRVRINPVMRRVSRRSELPMAPVQIPQPLCRFQMS